MPSPPGPLECPVRAGVLAEVPSRFRWLRSAQTDPAAWPEGSPHPFSSSRGKGGLCCHLVVTTEYCRVQGAFAQSCP